HTAYAYGTVGLNLSQAGNQIPTVVKSPHLGGAGGNVFMYLQDDTSGILYYLGRCVQDFKTGNDNGRGPFTNHGSLGGFTDVVATATTCSNKGSSLTIGTTSGTDNPTGHLILTNSFWDVSRPTPQHIDPTDIVANAVLTLVTTNKIPKQGNVNGPGGNPNVKEQSGELVLNQDGTFNSFT